MASVECSCFGCGCWSAGVVADKSEKQGKLLSYMLCPSICPTMRDLCVHAGRKAGSNGGGSRFLATAQSAQERCATAIGWSVGSSAQSTCAFCASPPWHR